ncbi:MAG: hypothetical protein HQ546_11065 [Planctomycetes bacterium]|nr:hypothetical protein [Planctomycetota bacterium]
MEHQILVDANSWIVKPDILVDEEEPHFETSRTLSTCWVSAQSASLTALQQLHMIISLTPRIFVRTRQDESSGHPRAKMDNIYSVGAHTYSPSRRI